MKYHNTKSPLSQVRSVFRVIELSQGFKGPLATNEGAFYGLDTLPLFIAVSIFVPCWPGRFITSGPSIPQSPASDGDSGRYIEKTPLPSTS